MKIGSSGNGLLFGAGACRVPVEVFLDPDALGRALAGRILDGVEIARAEGRAYLLGCPAGRSLRSTYISLAALAEQRGADLTRFGLAMMDEYLVATPRGPDLCPSEAHYSCRGFGHREILERINRRLSRDRRIPQENLWFPEPREPMAYEERLRAAGGIDLFLVAAGKTDGHVAFNPAGTTLDEGTRVIRMSAATRRDNLESFPSFGSLDEVPELGVSVGLGTIARLSRRVALVVTGADKRAAVLRLRRCNDFNSDWPASFIYRCQDPTILVDRFASPAA